MAEKKSGAKKASAKDLPAKVAAEAAKAIKGGRMRLDPLKKNP